LKRIGAEKNAVIFPHGMLQAELTEFNLRKTPQIATYGLVGDLNTAKLFSGEVEIAAKIIVTPFNLITNFLFMKALTFRMNSRDISL